MSGYNKEEKTVLNFDVKERIGIGNSLPLHVYHLVQNCSTTQEMMVTLSHTFDREDIPDEEVSKGKSLMTQVIESHVDAPRNSVSTFDADLSQATTNSKSQD